MTYELWVMTLRVFLGAICGGGKDVYEEVVIG